MELGLILGRNLEKPGKRQNLGVFKVFQGLIFHFCRFPGFSRFSRSPGNPEHVFCIYQSFFRLVYSTIMSYLFIVAFYPCYIVRFPFVNLLYLISF